MRRAPAALAVDDEANGILTEDFVDLLSIPIFSPTAGSREELAYTFALTRTSCVHRIDVHLGRIVRGQNG